MPGEDGYVTHYHPEDVNRGTPRIRIIYNELKSACSLQTENDILD